MGTNSFLPSDLGDASVAGNFWAHMDLPLTSPCDPSTSLSFPSLSSGGVDSCLAGLLRGGSREGVEET